MRTLTLPDSFTLTPDQVAELLSCNYETVLSYINQAEGHKLKLDALDLGTGKRRAYRIPLANFCDFCTRNKIKYQIAA